MQHEIQTLISQMTLEEKAALCSGLDNWHTMPIERLGIPSVMMADGPHGVRKETDEPGDDFLTNPSQPATCFPSAVALASSWDPELMFRLGEALGEKCLSCDVSILLGPGINIKRSPLCGRNFEYYSEDPVLAGKMAAGFIKGVQSKGIGTSLKHFAANNQETSRMTSDSIIDERTLRELYLTNFEITVKTAKPWTVMCGYNKLCGTFCSENRTLLTTILRDEWGFDGLVMSDWGAVNERAEGLASGLDLEMPAGGKDSEDKIIAAVNSGKLPEHVLDTAVERILRLVFKSAEHKQENAAYDIQAHHQLARHIAGECMVLLKNEGVLPFERKGRLAVIGALAKRPRFQGGGTSRIQSTMTEIPLEKIQKTAGCCMDITFCEWYPMEENSTFLGFDLGNAWEEADDKLIRKAVDAAAAADRTVIFAGLPDSFESEGYDRKHMRLPQNQTKLIEAVSKAANKIVVVLMNGSPIEMPWIDCVDGVLEGYLGGQASGGAIADILFGNRNPSGKLAETFPGKLGDNPTFLNFPGSHHKVRYGEGIFVGYRYYEKKQIKPLFPFGFGLSYTQFTYEHIETDSDEIDETGTVTVKARVRNSGSVAGKETVQFYVRDIESGVIRPEKELRDFIKVALEPGEEKTVSVTLGKRAFAYYDEDIHGWQVETGDFEILVGGSSDNIPLKTTVTVRSTAEKKISYTRNSTVGEVLKSPLGAEILRQMAGAELLDSLPPFVLQMPLRSIHMQMPEINEEVIHGLLALLNT